MINRKYLTQVYSLFMAFFMSGLMSFMVSVINIGLVENIVFIWLRAWVIAFFIAYPTILFISPHVQKMVEFVMEKDE